MPFDDAIIGNGTDFDPRTASESLIRSINKDIPANGPIDIRALNTRLGRKLGTSTPVAEPETSSDLPDFSAQASPPPAADVTDKSLDFSTQAVEPPALGPELPATSLTDYPVEVVKGVTSGVKNMFAGGLKGASTYVPDAGAQPDYDALGNPLGTNNATEIGAVPAPIKDRTLFKAGQAVEDFGKDTLAPRPGFEPGKSWTRDISEGAGSMVAGLGVSMIPGIGPALAGGLFTLSGSGEAIDNAVNGGATMSQAERAGMIGGAAGATDMIDTLLPFLGGTGKALGFIKRVGVAAVKGALMEGGQEGVQQLMQNAIAKNIYKPDQDLFEDVPRSVAIAAILGGGVGGLSGAASRRNKASAPADAGTPPSGADTGSAGPQPGPQPGPNPNPNATAEDFKKAEDQWYRDNPDVERPWTPPDTSKMSEGEWIQAFAAARDAHGGARMDDILRSTGLDDAAIAAMSEADKIDAVIRAKPPQKAGAQPDGATAEQPKESPQAKAAPAEDDHYSVLRAYGYSDEDINAMAPRQRAREAADARAEGVDPIDAAKKYPRATTAEQGASNPAGTRAAPIRAETAADVTKALPAPPTEAQAQAENYRHAHVELPALGLAGRNSISIETGVGQERKGTDPDGKPWSITMEHAAYGRIKGTKGADGQPLDIFVGPHPTSPYVFVVDQHHTGGKGFDEHKILAGFRTPIDALHAYANSYADKGGDRIGGVTAMSPEDFKAWLKTDTTKPLKAAKAADVSAPTDTGKNVPESRATLKAQQNQLIAGERSVQMFPEGTREMPLPKGMERTSTERGTFHFDPAKTTAAYVQELSRQGRENEMLGLGSVAKAEVMRREAAGEKPLTVVERTPDGIEVRAAAGTDSTIEKQRAELEKGKSPGNTVAVERTAKTVATRKAADQPLSLLQFIASRGGIRPDAELDALDLDGQHRVHIPGRKGFFSVVKSGGMTHDRMREAAQEAGYLPAPASGTTTLRDFYDAIDGELRGNRRMAAGDELTRTKREESQDDEESAHYRQKAIDDAHADIITEFPDIPNDLAAFAAQIAADENLGVDDAVEQAAMRFVDEDGARYDVTPDDLNEIFGEGYDNEIQEARAREDGDAARSEGGQERRSGEGEEAGGDGQRVQAAVEESQQEQDATVGAVAAVDDYLNSAEPGADGKEQSVIPGAEKIADGELAQRGADRGLKPKVAQKDVGGLFGDSMDQSDLMDMIPRNIAAVETALGEDADKVAPVDIARAAEIMAENPGMDVPDAFGQAVAETTVQQGFITEQEAVEAYGEQVRDILEPARTGASESSQGDQQERIEDQPASAGDRAQDSVAARGGETVEGKSTGDSKGNADAVAPATAEQQTADSNKGANGAAAEGAYDTKLTDEAWWNNGLTPFGRRQALDETGIYTTDTIKWHYLNKGQQAKLAKFRRELTAAEGMDAALSNMAGSIAPLTQAERDDRAARPPVPDWFADIAPLLPLNTRGKPDMRVFDRIASDVAGVSRQKMHYDNLSAEQKIEVGKRLSDYDPATNGEVVNDFPAYTTPMLRDTLDDSARVRGMSPDTVAKMRAELERRNKAERDAPTWAEIMAALPLDAAGHKDSELAFRLMSEITGERNVAFRSLTPEQSVELLDRIKAATGESDGVSAPVSGGNAAAEPENVSATAGQQGTGSARRVEGAGSGADVSGDTVAGTAAADNAEPAGGRGTDASSDVPVSDRNDDEAGRAERATAERAARNVAGENYHIAPGSLGESRGPKDKARDNIAAIKMANRLVLEDDVATKLEQMALARYVGWGGIKGAFPDADGNFAKGFEAIGEEVKSILTPQEYETARRSIQYAHYTAENVISSMWSAAEKLGFKGGKVFEPGMGVGHFAGLMPPDIAAATSYSGVEMDHVTARIAKLLYPRWGVRREDFTRMPLAENAFDLAIGNPPFADIAIKSDPKYAQQGFLLHDYFFAKSLDGVRPGGLLMFVTSAGTMNKLDPSARKYLADRANLVGAIRLPGNAFKENAGTEVTTDIVILRKLMPGETAGDQTWTQTANVTLPGTDGKPVTGQISRYFVDNPDMVLGDGDFADKLYEGRYSVKAPKGFDLKKALENAIERLPSNVMQDAETATERAEVDFSGTETKDGSYYVKDGVLMQQRDGAGYPVASRGKGVEGGRTAAEMERIRGLIPIRDALRETFAADLAENVQDGQQARARLNAAYDAFVAKFGPINKAEISYRRPSSIQQEAARSEAREEARYADERFDEGSFDPSSMIAAGKSLNEIARARTEARETLGEAYREGSFDPNEMPDLIMDKRPNIAPFADDQENYRLRAIEHYDAPTGRAEKSPVFFKNIITKDREPEIKSIGDATLYVMNQTGRLDIDAIGAMVGKSRTETIEALGDRIYQVPDTTDVWETREKYLSGNVRKKLVIAEAAARKNPALRRNVDALEAAQPAPLAPSQIGASLGMPWIPPEVVSQFGTEALGLDKLNASYSPAIATWTVSGDTGSVAAVTTWGTSRRNATALIGDVLNRQSPKIYDQVDENTRVLNQVATQAAQEKMQAIRDRFNEWVFADEKRADRLATFYNENYNNLVVQEFDGGYLTTPGIAEGWSWRPHQKRVVARIIQNGNTYMAHAVGAGKTSAMIGAGMEMRRLGLVKKPMYAVPNHMLGQFTKEFYEQYPTARIMVADDRQFHTDRRKQFMANVAVSDLDAVIITHSSFGMIPLSAEFKDGVITQEIETYRAALADVPKGGDNRITRSRIEKQIERLEQRLSGRSNRKADAVFTFDEMGVDFLFVDEAHLFRKLDFTTQMSNLKGITPDGSGMAWDLFMKSKLLEQRNPGRSLVLASGTPVTNTMAELFTVSRYLQMQELKDRSLSQFDAWAGAFGENVTELEQDAAGGYKPVSRFARFVNVAELSAMVRQVMDVVTSRQLEQYVVRPKIKGGKRKLHLAEQSPELEAYNRNLAARMKAMEGRGKPQPGDDIMLTVINDGRHAAIDMRLVTGEHGGRRTNQPSKLDLMIDNMFGIWKDTKNKPFYKPKNGDYDMSKPAASGPATQMAFVNLGISGSRGFSVPDYIRSELVRRGVPRAEIALIADFKNHVAKQKLFNDMNEGKVRVLIGSTAKMATGVNAQRRLYAIHNLDPLWYPSDDEQRNGRALRQGNMNPEIEINDYAAKGTYDSTMWGMMEKKARFIQGFFEGDPSLRSMDDLGEASQYEQAKAMTTNDPRLMKLTDMRQELEKANRRKAAFDNDRYAIRQRRASEKSSLEYYEARAIQIEKDIAQRVPLAGEKFTAKIGRTSYDKRVEFGDALLKKLDSLATKENSGKEFPIGEISGFALVATPQKMGDEVAVNVDFKRNGGAATHVTVGTSGLGAVRSMESILAGFDGELANARSRSATARKFLSESENDAKKKFTGESDMETLASEIRVLQAELSAKKDEPPATPTDDGEALSAVGDLSRADLSSVARDKIPEIEGLLDSVVKMISNMRTEFTPGYVAVDNVVGYGDIKNAMSAGAYFPKKALIRLALAGNPEDAIKTALHESYHAVEDRFLTDKENALMKRETERLRLYVKRKRTRGLTPVQIDALAGYEVRAMAFEEYTFDKINGSKSAGDGLHIGVRGWFDRLMKALRRLMNGLRDLGFKTYEDIFDAARTGEYAQRPARDTNQIDSSSLSAINNTRNGPQARETVAEILEDRNMYRLATLSRTLGVGRINAVKQRAYWQDRFIRVKRAEQSVEGDVPSRMSAYQAESLYYGRTGEKLETLEKEAFDPLIADMKDRDISLEGINEYLYAKHAPERNARMDEINHPELMPGSRDLRGRGSGMSDEEAKAVMDRITAEGKMDDYRAIEARIRKIINDTRNGMIESGLISQDAADAWAQQYEFYVPLRGFAEGTEDETYGGKGRGYDVRGAETKKAFGRLSRADGPLPYIMQQAEMAIVRGEKNRVGNAWLRFVQSHPDDTRWTVDRPPLKKTIDKATGLVTTINDPFWQNREDVFATKIGGRPVLIQMHGEDGVNLARALKNMGAENLNQMLRFARAVTTTMSRLATQWNPNFIIPNLVRDVGEAYINMQAQDQKGFIAGFSKHLLPAMKGSFNALSGKGDQTNRYVRAFKEFDAAGGRIRFFGLDNAVDIGASVDRKLRRLEGGALNSAKDAGRAAAEAFEWVNGSIENATRLAAYMAARDVGMSQADSAMLARNLTVDFNKKGEAAGWMNALYMFSNVAFQGARRNLSAMNNKYVRRAAYSLIAMGALSALLGYLGGDDDDAGENRYSRVPAWDRDKNFVFMLPGGGYIKIPLPFGFAMFKVLGDRMAGVALGRDKPGEALTHILKSIGDSFSPLGEESSSLFSIFPSALRPAVHIESNKNWNGKKLYPDYDFQKNRPESEQAFQSTSALAKEAARKLNSASGGSPYKAGAIDWHPGSIQHVFESMTGGLGKFLLTDTLGTAKRAWDGDKFDPTQAPIIRRFYGNTASPQSENARYYELREEAQKNGGDAIKAARKDRGRGMNKDAAEAFLSDNKNSIRNENLFKAADQQIKPLRDRRERIENDENMSRADRRAALDEITEKMRAIQNRARKQYLDNKRENVR